MLRSHKKLVILICCLLIITGFCICLFQTGNVLGVVYAHVVLGVSETDRQQISANMFLANDIEETISLFNEDGWLLLQQENHSYLLEKNGKYRNLVFVKHTITGYDVIMISDEYDDLSQHKAQIQ